MGKPNSLSTLLSKNLIIDFKWPIETFVFKLIRDLILVHRDQAFQLIYLFIPLRPPYFQSFPNLKIMVFNWILLKILIHFHGLFRFLKRGENHLWRRIAWKNINDIKMVLYFRWSFDIVCMKDQFCHHRHNHLFFQQGLFNVKFSIWWILS